MAKQSSKVRQLGQPAGRRDAGLTGDDPDSTEQDRTLTQESRAPRAARARSKKNSPPILE